MAKKVLDFLLYSNIFVSLCAALMLSVSKILLLVPEGLYLELFVFCATLSVYNFQRIFPFLLGEMKEELNQRQKWISRNLTFLILLSTVSLFIASIVYLFFIKQKLFTGLLLFPLFLISFWYAVDLKRVFKPSTRKIRKLRTIPYLKIFLIGITWNIATIGLPAIEENIPLNSLGLWWLFAERLLFIIAITLPFDIRDMEQDKKYQVITIPHKIGYQQTVALAVVLAVVSGMLSLIRFWILPHTAFAAWPLFISALVSIAIILKSKPEKSDYFFSGLVESTMVIQFLLVWMAKIFKDNF